MNRSARQRRGASRGFTLLELLVVVAILVLLAGIVTPAVVRQLGGAKHDTAQVQVNALKAAVEYFNVDMGRYPTSEEGLGVLVTPPDDAQRWNGPYLSKSRQLVDPWGNAYVYRLSSGAQSAEVLSLGSDGAVGGQGDAADVSSAD